MDAFQIIWAISASFYGLLGLWAAVVRRHWFLRFVTVGLFLLSALLIPAYEVVIEFGLQIAVIALGLWLARGKQAWPTRLSLETALLAMVVFAVMAAVLGRMPTLQANNWVERVTVGMCTGLAALLALWVVCGRRPLWQRIAVGAVAMMLWAALFHFGLALSSAAHSHALPGAFAQQYDWESVSNWLRWWLPILALAGAILCSAIWLGRASGWFTASEANPEKRGNRGRGLARAGLCGAFVLLLAPMAYLGYRLMTPEPWPEEQLPSPNGHDDFVAAGQMTPLGMIDPTQVSRTVTDAQLAAEVEGLAPVFDRIDLGLSRCSDLDPRLNDKTREDHYRVQAALTNAQRAMLLRLAHVMNTGVTAEKIDAALRHAKFMQQAYRGACLEWTAYSHSSISRQWVRGDLRSLLKETDRDLCLATAKRLDKLEGSMEPLSERMDTQWRIDAHAGWFSHAQNILTRWSGREPWGWMLQRERSEIAEFRILAVQYALRAYCLEHGRLPKSLEELTPNYLSAVPRDPFGEGALKMKVTPKTVLVYGNGEDGDDDGGVDYAANARGNIDFSDGDHVNGVTLPELGLGATMSASDSNQGAQ